MSLLESEGVKDNVEKSRLFDTVKDSGRSATDYLKVLGVVVVVVLLAGGLALYMMAPAEGEQVRPPDFLQSAVRTHFIDKEKRSVETATFYLCREFYAARVQLEQRPDITARQMDEGRRWLKAVEKAKNQWEITSSVDEDDKPPCG
ncbi:MAG TPA: hypothetical protein PKD26_01800 [Pyrinomonadaceae bacterium]|nr:hypothetical protein [Pyrinomonadaceae bacterium]